jgi:hypothetical protein
MSTILNFAGKWSKWYRVLRHRKGFGRIDSARFGLWLAQGSEKAAIDRALRLGIAARA